MLTSDADNSIFDLRIEQFGCTAGIYLFAMQIISLVEPGVSGIGPSGVGRGGGYSHIRATQVCDSNEDPTTFVKSALFFSSFICLPLFCFVLFCFIASQKGMGLRRKALRMTEPLLIV